MIVFLVFFVLLVVPLVFSLVVAPLFFPDDHSFALDYGHLWRRRRCGGTDLHPYVGGTDIDPDSSVGWRDDARHAQHADNTTDSQLLQIHVPVHFHLPFRIGSATSAVIPT